MKEVFRVWTKWECGERDVVFMSRDSALEWLRKNAVLRELISGFTEDELTEDDYPKWIQRLIEEEGLVGIERVEVIGND